MTFSALNAVDARARYGCEAITKHAHEAGIRPFGHRLPATTSTAALITLVHRLNADPNVNTVNAAIRSSGGTDLLTPYYNV